MIFLLPVEWPEMPPYERLLTYYFWRILWRHWRPFLGHQAWTTLRKRNVFLLRLQTFFLIFVTYFTFSTFFNFIWTFFTSMFPVSRMHFKNAPPIQTRRRAHLSGPTPPHRTRQNSPVCVVSGVTVWIKSVRFASISIRARLHLCTLSTAATTICPLYQLKTVQKQFP